MPPDAADVDSATMGSDVAASLPDVAPNSTTVADDAATGGVPIDLAPARLRLDPPAADFGYVVRGCGDPPKIVTFRVTNEGGSPSGAVAIDLERPFSLGPDGCSGRELGAGASCEVQIKFEPAFDGIHTGTMVARASPGGLVAAALKGLGNHLDALLLTPNSADFGSTNVGSVTAARSFEMGNIGDRPFTVTGATVSTTDFVITKDDCTGKPLPARASCAVEVAFKPATGGSKAAILTLTASGCGGPAIQASLAGRATSSEPPAASPSSINFGTVVVGAESARRTSTLSNFGGMPSGALSTALEGANASQFYIEASTCVGPLAAGASCTVAVVFRPTTVGDKSASLVISSAGGLRAVVSLSGSGLSP